MSGIFQGADDLARDHRREARRRRAYIVDELGLDPELVAKLGVEGARAEIKRREKIRNAKRNASEMKRWASEMKRWRAEMLRREQEQAEIDRVVAREARSAAARKGWHTRRDHKAEALVWKKIFG